MRIGILVVAYNAVSTLAQVLDRIPADFRGRVTKVLVGDDYSSDATYLVGLGYQQVTDLPLEVIRHPRNLGYGGNQKAGYRWAIENDIDIIVLLLASTHHHLCRCSDDAETMQPWGAGNQDDAALEAARPGRARSPSAASE